MTTKPIKLPNSKGKFRRDIYERSLEAIRQFPPPKGAYRAFGETIASPRHKDAQKVRALRSVAKVKSN